MSDALVAREEFAKTALLRNIRDGRVHAGNITPWQRQILNGIVKAPHDLDPALELTVNRILDPVINPARWSMAEGPPDPTDRDVIERIDPPHRDLPYAETPAVLAMRARKRALGK